MRAACHRPTASYWRSPARQSTIASPHSTTIQPSWSRMPYHGARAVALAQQHRQRNAVDRLDRQQPRDRLEPVRQQRDRDQHAAQDVRQDLVQRGDADDVVRPEAGEPEAELQEEADDRRQRHADRQHRQALQRHAQCAKLRPEPEQAAEHHRDRKQVPKHLPADRVDEPERPDVERPHQVVREIALADLEVDAVLEVDGDQRPQDHHPNRVGEHLRQREAGHRRLILVRRQPDGRHHQRRHRLVEEPDRRLDSVLGRILERDPEQRQIEPHPGPSRLVPPLHCNGEGVRGWGHHSLTHRLTRTGAARPARHRLVLVDGQPDERHHDRRQHLVQEVDRRLHPVLDRIRDREADHRDVQPHDLAPVLLPPLPPVGVAQLTFAPRGRGVRAVSSRRLPLNRLRITSSHVRLLDRQVVHLERPQQPRRRRRDLLARHPHRDPGRLPGHHLAVLGQRLAGDRRVQVQRQQLVVPEAPGQLAQRPVEDQPPLVDHDHSITQRLDVVHVVRGQQDRRLVLALVRPDELADLLLHHHVQADRRLVQEQHVRLVEQRRRQLALHPLAQRELADLDVQQRPELQQVGQLAEGAPVLRVRDPVDLLVEQERL